MVKEVGLIVKPRIGIASLSDTVNEIMKQRIDIELAKRRVPIEIELRIEKGVRIVANPSPDPEVVLERVEIADVFVQGAIPSAVKQRMRIASLAGSVAQIVDERWDARGCDVGVRHQIPIGIKQWMRIEGLEPARRDVMEEWVNRRMRGAQIAIAIIGGREQTVGVASFVRAAGQEMSEGVNAGSAHVRILSKVPFSIESCVKEEALLLFFEEQSGQGRAPSSTRGQRTTHTSSPTWITSATAAEC
jgi:hypothetical protein